VFRNFCSVESLVGISIHRLCAESLRSNRKAYILKLFLCLELRGPNVLFYQSKRYVVMVLRKY
jgi:hypothetical protein